MCTFEMHVVHNRCVYIHSQYKRSVWKCLSFPRLLAVRTDSQEPHLQGFWDSPEISAPHQRLLNYSNPSQPTQVRILSASQGGIKHS